MEDFNSLNEEYIQIPNSGLCLLSLAGPPVRYARLSGRRKEETEGHDIKSTCGIPAAISRVWRRTGI